MKALRLGLVLLLLMGCAPAFSQYDALQPQGIYSSDFTIDDRPRSITYYMPANFGKSDEYPLVIVLHDEKSNAKKFIQTYGSVIQAKADAAGSVVMYPDALAGHWNTNLNTTSQGKDSVNDVSFISIMLDFFIQQFHCDASRIYLLGIGNGGAMCYRFHCERPAKLAALATIHASPDATVVKDCLAKKPIPVSDINGEADSKASISKAWDFLLMHTKSD